MTRLVLAAIVALALAGCDITNTVTNTGNGGAGGVANPAAPSTPTASGGAGSTPTATTLPFGIPARPTADYVAAIKAALAAQGASAAGPCGAFAITSRVAVGLSLTDPAWGLLAANGGTACGAYVVDVVIRADGPAFDILLDAGGSNTPAWNAIAVADGGPRWRPAVVF